MNEKIDRKRGNVVNMMASRELHLLGFIPCDFALGLVTSSGQRDISK